jgi:hypothetical protein
MKIRSIITSLSLLFCIGLTSFGLDISNGNKNNHLEAESTETTNKTITMADMAAFLETKKEHYPLSDEFVEKYQQESGGYIDNARKAGLVVDKQLHEPNQKWHYFESWLYPTIAEGMSWDESAKSRSYTYFRCPELLLWIFEASNVDPNLVREAKLVAERGKVNDTNEGTICSEMRAIVTWDTIAPAVYDFLNNADIPYNVTVNDGEGYEVQGLESSYLARSEVTFSVNVTDNNKYVYEVKMNDEVLTPNNGIYTFKMPYSDVTISVTLKDKILATGVTLEPSTLELYVGNKNKLVVASPTPSNTTDIASWSVVEGSDLISIVADGNEVKVTALKEGTAKLKVTYNEKANAICTVNISPKDPSQMDEISVKYVINNTYKSKVLTEATDIFNSFVLDGDGDNILKSVSSFSYVYSGGKGGSGDNAWSTGNLLKLGSTSYNGSLTLDLESEINRVIITGYAHKTACKIRVGDSGSSDWTNGTDTDTKSYSCSDVTVISKSELEASNESTITLDFESTTSFRIDTINTTSTKHPFYITSIEFIYKSN